MTNRKQTVGSVAEEAILAGKDTAGVIAAVKKVFKDSKISESSVGWYRNNLRKQGKIAAAKRGKPAKKPVAKKAVAKKPAAKKVVAKRKKS